MKYRITPLKKPTQKNIEDIIYLYKEAGWFREWDTEKRIKQIIEKSYLFVVAFYKDKIVAMGRVISDGINDAYIQDLKVRDDFKNKGLGTAIVNFIKKALLKKGFKWIGLISEKDTEEFYIKNGFKYMKGMKFFIYEFKKNRE